MDRNRVTAGGIEPSSLAVPALINSNGFCLLMQNIPNRRLGRHQFVLQ